MQTSGLELTLAALHEGLRANRHMQLAGGADHRVGRDLNAPGLLTTAVEAADACPEIRWCFPCLAAEEFAECGRVRHADTRRDGCASEFSVH